MTSHDPTRASTIAVILVAWKRTRNFGDFHILRPFKVAALYCGRTVPGLPESSARRTFTSPERLEAGAPICRQCVKAFRSEVLQDASSWPAAWDVLAVDAVDSIAEETTSISGEGPIEELRSALQLLGLHDGGPHDDELVVRAYSRIERAIAKLEAGWVNPTLVAGGDYPRTTRPACPCGQMTIDDCTGECGFATAKFSPLFGPEHHDAIRIFTPEGKQAREALERYNEKTRGRLVIGSAFESPEGHECGPECRYCNPGADDA